MAEGEAREKSGRGGLIGFVLAVALGLGAGWAGETFLAASPEGDAGDMKAKASVAEIVAYESLKDAKAVVPLSPITTNLRGPEEVWVRLELAAVFADAPSTNVADAVHADALALMRSLSLREIATPSGFLWLRADLRERARHISDGAVTDVLVRTFLIE